ncbi:MAG: cbb3-type cytochrome c oxidase subunit I, partial [Chloroflexi bacterium]|nr:cbb3-type cytochrome c oxidase subunit I [Chloroflexota bacterium]
FAGIYYWFPKMTGRMYNETLGRIHFVGMTVFYNITFMVMFTVGAAGMNRRIAAYPDELSGTNLFITITAFILGASFLPFVYNMIVSWLRGPIASDNPWGARTLEWQTSSPPPLENFAHPPVISDPYGYGTPSRVPASAQGHAPATGHASGGGD